MSAACAHDVAQDANSGPDAKVKGAKAITLDQNEGKAKGVVTYPGGDRVDWKMVELPDKAKGELDVKLTWKPPRPGLQLAFDVFDQWNIPIVESKKGEKRGKGRIREAQIDNASGKYFIRVYAKNRGDAGTYNLSVEFKPGVQAIQVDMSKVDVPDPPKLAALPEVEVECTEFTFDVKNPGCAKICPAAGAPAGWPACAGKCPTPPDPANPACQGTMPCPAVPDRNIKSCLSRFPKCPDPRNPDPNNPKCDNIKADPVNGRVIAIEVASDGVNITVSVGSNSGVDKGWRGQMMRDNGTPVDGGDVQIIRVSKTSTVGKVKLTTDSINANPTVRFSPPK